MELNNDYLLSIAHKAPFSYNVPLIALIKVEFITIDAGLLTHTMILAINIHMASRVLRIRIDRA